jgi:tetratricopeptide (TPR) repeat protein
MAKACRWLGTAWLTIALLSWVGAAAGWAASPQDQQAKPAYSLAEYNAFQTAHNEQNAQAKVKALDDFVVKYPASALLQYVYFDYYHAYYTLKNYPQTIEFADKLLALGDKVDFGSRLDALLARAEAFFGGSSDKAMQTPEQLTKARDAAAQGLQMLGSWQKPDKWTDDQFTQQKKSIGMMFNSVAGISESGLKDYKSAVDSYKAALAIDPNDAVTHYRLGAAYLQSTPPDGPSGYWELARAIALKVPGDTQVRAYLRSQLLHYQQLSCDKLVDDEMNQLVTLAAAGGDRPATLSIPSADDLKKAQEDTADFMPWLQEGGDHGKTMWMATCGLEYPDVAVRVMEITPGDGDRVTLKVFRAATEEEMQAATAPNMEVHVMGQPEAKRIQKDDFVRFTGTLTAYSQSPFMLTWDNAKVNAEDIAPEKAAPGVKRPSRALPPKK